MDPILMEGRKSWDARCMSLGMCTPLCVHVNLGYPCGIGSWRIGDNARDASLQSAAGRKSSNRDVGMF